MKDFLLKIKKSSPYYRKLWGECPLELDQLPIVDQESFWQANSWDHNQLLTGALGDGVVFKSGGTTGKPKFSVFTKSEWEEFTSIFGQGMAQVLKPGERVGNLFYAGELYASFLFIEKSLEKCSTPVLTFPIAGATDLSEVIQLVRTYQIDVLAGVPTTFVRLAQLLLENNATLPLTKILYGGEALFDDQRSMLSKAFATPQIVSIGYASVDAGHLGASAPELGNGAHWVLPGSVMEIVDEEGHVIKRPGISGRLLMTNLTRHLMPIIRYPVGDQAQWIDVDKSFRVLGRADEGARVGPVTVNRDDIATILGTLNCDLAFQLIITRHQGLDRLEIHCHGQIDQERALICLLQQRPMLKSSMAKGLIAAPEFISVNELERNPRTGKLRFVIDRRFT